MVLRPRFQPRWRLVAMGFLARFLEGTEIATFSGVPLDHSTEARLLGLIRVQTLTRPAGITELYARRYVCKLFGSLVLKAPGLVDFWDMHDLIPFRDGYFLRFIHVSSISGFGFNNSSPLKGVKYDGQKGKLGPHSPFFQNPYAVVAIAK